jgi:hypothetical protein
MPKKLFFGEFVSIALVEIPLLFMLILEFSSVSSIPVSVT